jgi:sugar/nucleoside kinase (ribokinase family)
VSKTYDVMAAGHLCLDIIPTIPDTGAAAVGDVLQPGKLVHVEAATLSTGGAVSNTGIAMRRLGNRVCFSARLGDDAFGRLTLDILREGGAVEGIRSVPGSVSSYTVVLAPPRIDRIFLHNPGANDEYGAEDLDTDLIGQCRLFHFGYPPLMARMYRNEGAELARIFQIAKEAGAVTSCDLALPDPASEAGQAPWRRIFERALPHLDIFLPSVEEAFYTLDRDRYLRLKQQHPGEGLIEALSAEDLSQMADEFLALGVKVVLLKTGHLGVYLKTGSPEAIASLPEGLLGRPEDWANRQLWCPSFSVSRIASATGAGDCAIAGFLTALLRGASPDEALRTANCLGWQNVQALDATSGVRSWDETRKLLQELREVNDVPALRNDWQWVEDSGVWAPPTDVLAGK